VSGWRAVFVTVVALAPLGRAVVAQQPSERAARRLSATRAELVDMLAALPPPPATAPLTSITAILQDRLAEGDFHTGDGVALVVDGEAQLTDTFVVGASREITLPGVGVMPLRGVLYTEIEGYLTRRLEQFLRDPAVRARGLMRVLVTGAVPRPGFYLVSTDALLSETLTAAGGVTSDAKLRELRAERAGTRVLAGPEMQAALAQGRTLDQVSLRSGDELIVPGGKGSSAYERARLVGVLLGIPLTIYSLTRIF